MDAESDAPQLIEQIPDELLLRVLSLLERFSQIRLRRVYSHWNELLRWRKPAIVKLDLDVAYRILVKNNGLTNQSVLRSLHGHRCLSRTDRQNLVVPVGTRYIVFTSERRRRNENGRPLYRDLDDLVFSCSAQIVELHEMIGKSQRDRLVGIVYDNLTVDPCWPHYFGSPVEYRGGTKVSFRDAAIWYRSRCQAQHRWDCDVPVVCPQADMILPDSGDLYGLIQRTAEEHLDLAPTERQWNNIEKYWSYASHAEDFYRKKLQKIFECGSKRIEFVGPPTSSQLRSVKKCALIRFLYLVRDV